MYYVVVCVVTVWVLPDALVVLGQLLLLLVFLFVVVVLVAPAGPVLLLLLLVDVGEVVVPGCIGVHVVHQCLFLCPSVC